MRISLVCHFFHCGKTSIFMKSGQCCVLKRMFRFQIGGWTGSPAGYFVCRHLLYFRIIQTWRTIRMRIAIWCGQLPRRRRQLQLFHHCWQRCTMMLHIIWAKFLAAMVTITAMTPSRVVCRRPYASQYVRLSFRLSCSGFLMSWNLTRCCVVSCNNTLVKFIWAPGNQSDGFITYETLWWLIMLQFSTQNEIIVLLVAFGVWLRIVRQ